MSTIGILAALHDEIATLLTAMGPEAVTHRIGQRDYHVGNIAGRKCVVVLARVGKVAASATAVTLIREFNASSVIFTGLAGAVAKHVRVGDVVVAQSLLQHDLDARPLFPRYEVPLLGRSYFDADVQLAALLSSCATDYLQEDLPGQISSDIRAIFGVVNPVVHCGTIISGDSFVSSTSGMEALRTCLPDALCVEMEGAAVAQVCFEYGVPCGVIRTVSDRADCSAGIDFNAFLKQVASFYSAGILRRFLMSYSG